MNNFLAFIRNAFLIDTVDNNRKVGLSQFRDESADFSLNKKSITGKDVKLSDLLRRA